MKFVSTCCAIGIILLASVHRLPAPIKEDATPTPAQEAPKPKKHSKPKSDEDSSGSSKSSPRPSGKARNLDGPKPVYPPEAAAKHLSGSGKYLLTFDQATGKVIDVTVSESAGSPILDNAAIEAFRQWHEDPQCAKEVTMTMTFGVAP